MLSIFARREQCYYGKKREFDGNILFINHQKTEDIKNISNSCQYFELRCCMFNLATLLFFLDSDTKRFVTLSEQIH